tara:strand:+ start:139 stop:549 length:411 start_codon:yes stop_codon:yes gene_type:complete
MATSAKWTIVMDDKKIICHDVVNSEGFPTAYKILDDDAFWNQEKFSNIWAIQYGTFAPSDTVEHRDDTPHCTWEEADLGDISQFTDKFDVAHLAQLQADWDADVLTSIDENDNEIVESEADQIARKGARPTSYSSS